MKKSILFFTLCIAVILALSDVCFAASKVVESPIIKTFVSGKQAKFNSVPITVNGEILLNANEILVKLGVPNDNKHIILDKNKQNLTINYGKIKIKMTANSKKATVDKSSNVLNSPPIIYKNKLYIPVKSTAQLLGMKFAWDNIEKGIYIQTVNDYNKVKAILDKAITKTKAVDKYIVESTSNDKLTEEHFINIAVVSKVDKKKMIKNINFKFDDSIADSFNVEKYLSNNFLYSKSSSNEKWEKELLSKKDYERWILDDDVSKFTISDILYCGLMLEESTKDNTIRLKGNVYLHENSVESKINSIYTYSEICINKSTNLISKITCTYSKYDKLKEFGFSSVASLTYRDFNGDFNVELPDESKMDFEADITPIALSDDEEAKVDILSSNIVKVPVIGALKNPYKIDVTEGIIFIIINNKNDFNIFKNLSDDAKKVFINQIVQNNYVDYIRCETVYGMVYYDGKVYTDIITGFDAAPENVFLEKYEEGFDITIVVQDKKNNTYSNYEEK